MEIERVRSDFFIGRENELDQFKKFLNSESSTRILNISGEPGIGKTQLLRQMQKYCSEFISDTIINKEIIDFFDIENCTKIGLMKQIAYEFDINNFSNFKKTLNLYFENIDLENRKCLQLQAENNFKEDYIAFANTMHANEKRIIIFFDSYESIQKIGIQETGIVINEKNWTTERWIEGELLPWICQYAYIIISGCKELQEISPFEVERKNLSPFTISEIELFLRNYLNSEDKIIELSKILCEYTNGIPILIALSIDSIRLNPDLGTAEKFLNDLQLEDKKIREQKDGALKKRMKEYFEKLLIKHISSITDMESKFIIFMTLAYRWMTVELFFYLKDSESLKSRLLEELIFKELYCLSFIKCKRGERLLLHHEIHRFILQYWWQEHDGEKKEREPIFIQINKYYEHKFLNDSTLPEEIIQLYRAESLGYMMFGRFEEGLDCLCETFKTAIQNQQYIYSIILLNILKNYYNHFGRYAIKNQNPNILPFLMEVIKLLEKWINYNIKRGENYKEILQEIQELLKRYQKDSFLINSQMCLYLKQISIYIENQHQISHPRLRKFIHILHLSDIHLGLESDAQKYLAQLEADLNCNLQIDRIDYLVISGDIANKSSIEDYTAAINLVNGIIKHFDLSPEHVIVVPGNHDLNWNLSKKAYRFMYNDELSYPLPEGRYIQAGELGVLLCDDDLYRQRFEYFNTYFYKKIHNKDYPINYKEQGMVYYYPDDQILFLTFNSSWNIDHYNKTRSSINPDALSYAIHQLLSHDSAGWVKIGVWHHPVTGQDAMNDAFLEQLSVNGFQICMHGHVHEAIEGYYKYDQTRGIGIIGAGTFGSYPKDLVIGVPWEYNLLIMDKEKNAITVKTRKRTKPDGAWSAAPLWGNKEKPKAEYLIKLNRGILKKN